MSPFRARASASWAWLKAHWYIPLFVAGILIGMALSRRIRDKGAVLAQVNAEIGASKAAAEAKRWQAELGAEKAAEKVEQTYRAQVEALDDQQKREAAALKSDPRALARYLVRAAGPRGTIGAKP